MRQSIREPCLTDGKFSSGVVHSVSRLKGRLFQSSKIVNASGNVFGPCRRVGVHAACAGDAKRRRANRSNIPIRYDSNNRRRTWPERCDPGQWRRQSRSR
ncbi:hypothetical protein X962_5307 [Burkholderia pseudomallei MSHR7343]|nr:hypothetical protein X962_5307 [Burkholderia pseudomallei MSHR7343]